MPGIVIKVAKIAAEITSSIGVAVVAERNDVFTIEKNSIFENL